MITARTPSRAGELVSLAERLRYMQLFRLAVAASALLFGLFAPEALGTDLGELAAGTAAYLVVSLLGEGIWRLWRRRGLTLFGALLIVDGFYLAWASYSTGGAGSPLRYLIVLHLVAVALLASYRTGMKLALWHSLLLLVVFHAQEAGLLEPADRASVLPGSEIQQLAAFASVFWLVAIATSSFSAVNERELRRRRVDLEALATLATELEEASDSRVVAEVLLDNLHEAFGLERSVLLAAREGELALVGSRGCERPVSTELQPASGSVLLEAIERRQTLLVSELERRSDAWLAAVFPAGRNFLVAPLSAEGGAIAVLVAEHGLRRGSRIERRVVSMVERFAAHGALALRNAWLLEQVLRMAATDGLTMIANRRTFDETLERELSRCRRYGDELGLILLDLDRFKQLNDEHGHQTGDDVLREVAAVLARNCRDFDTPARYGGEEFAIVLPGCSTEQAVETAERLREVLLTSDTPVPITASFGVAVFPAHAGESASLVEVADEALFESKRAGRNRVTVSTRRRLADAAAREAAA